MELRRHCRRRRVHGDGRAHGHVGLLINHCHGGKRHVCRDGHVLKRHIGKNGFRGDTIARRTCKGWRIQWMVPRIIRTAAAAAEELAVWHFGEAKSGVSWRMHDQNAATVHIKRRLQQAVFPGGLQCFLLSLRITFSLLDESKTANAICSKTLANISIPSAVETQSGIRITLSGCSYDQLD